MTNLLFLTCFSFFCENNEKVSNEKRVISVYNTLILLLFYQKCTRFSNKLENTLSYCASLGT
jgi:hypothetical protein